MTNRLWGISATAVLAAGLLAGCGASGHLVAKGQAKSQRPVTARKLAPQYATPQVKMSLAQVVHKYTTGIYKGLPGGLKPKWGPGTVPENVAALYVYATTPKLNGGGDFPDLTANVPGAPKTPPFSLAPYPKNGTIQWNPQIDQAEMQPWALQGAKVAARWLMADEGNDPMTAWQYLNPQEPVAHGGAYKKGITSNGAGFTMDIAANGYSGGYSYYYDTWGKVLGVGDAAMWTHAMGFKTPPSAMIGPNQRVLHEAVATVEYHAIVVYDHGYILEQGGPTDVLMADIKGLGWRVLASGSIPGKMLKVLPGHFVIPKGATSHE